MSILPHHKHPLRCRHHVQSYHPRSASQIHCSATTNTTTTKHSREHNHIIVPPRLTTQTQPPLVPSPPRPIFDDPNLQSTWSHRAWVASGCTTVLVSLAKSAIASINSDMWVEPILAGFIGYVLADLGSGVFHWAIDNYGDASTPVFGSQIEAFQGHHKWPWTITRRQFANNLHSLARAVTLVVVPTDLAGSDAVVHAFVGVCSGCIMFSQQFHAWAHGTKSRLPPLVVALQEAGVLVSRAEHAAHHRAPYNNNYCIVSGAWNEVLDRGRVFEALEMVLFFRFGVRPRSWSEPISDWIEEVEGHALIES